VEEYSKCLRVLKDLLLPCAYGHRNESIPEDVLLLAATSLKDIVGGLFGLVQQLNMWRALLAPPQPPRIHAEWNIKKTASDKITKMIYGSCNYPTHCIHQWKHTGFSSYHQLCHGYPPTDSANYFHVLQKDRIH
jgi:hypothetical protein